MRNRIDRLRAVAADLGADAAIVTHYANRRYFSGFPAVDDAPDESYGLLLVAPESAVLYTSRTNLPWAAASTRSPVEARHWEQPWQAFLGQRLQDRSLRRVAFEDRAMTVADHAAIVSGASEIELIPAGNAFHSVRAVKDDEELASIAEAARITDAAFIAATRDLRPGVTERELAWRIELALRELGAEAPAFPISVAAGPHGARPHHDPTDRPLEEGEAIVIDLGATVDGYRADLTRTIVIGEAPPEFTDRYNTVLAAQQAALAGTSAGMTGREVDQLARECIAAAGYEDAFVHGLGHGVGLLIHERPSLGVRSDDVLEPGHVITIEPGIYLEGWGGIRVEDLCLVTRDGLEVLSHAPK